MNCKRKSRCRLFLLMRSRTPPISSEFWGGGLNTPNAPSRYATGCWGFRSSGIWHYDIGWVVPDARIVMHSSPKSSSERKIFFNCLNLKIKSLWSFRMSAMPSQATHYHFPEDFDLALHNPAEPYNSPHQTLCVADTVADVQHWTCCRKRMCQTHCSLSSRLLSCCRLGRQMKMCRVSVICVTSCPCSR